jgi:hypothetical protein
MSSAPKPAAKAKPGVRKSKAPVGRPRKSDTPMTPAPETSAAEVHAPEE